MKRVLLISAVAIFATACASTSTDTAAVTESSESSVTVETEVAPEALAPTQFDLAMDTVSTLVAAGNEQHAIDRIAQVLGRVELDDSQRAGALFKMAELQLGAGNNVFGAIDSLSELIEDYPDSEYVSKASEMRDTARGEATSLNALLLQGELPPTKQFETMFRLGQHQDAADLMLARNLKPDNAYILDMYQIGYLCDDDTLTGPKYNLSEPDGTERTVLFCDFGK